MQLHLFGLLPRTVPMLFRAAHEATRSGHTGGRAGQRPQCIDKRQQRQHML